ncbi:gamma-glutamyltransferase [Hoeflea sp. WL0058]|uniref:Glutathione hydrolase proenzyme n=1 Tax=Flavimaribacter sediminis TaxID=2865987 RepID=A0AAE2ZLQ9_9HYPH|nr:gamma-glutamyltransferase [Flavimaribacter sediminis]MBW8637186.1 gamma-glutamyltransferase [Flavimaribacter sediminis]
MAATSHPLATLAAVDILRSGGNCVDAAIAAVALQSVMEPQMTGIGGDCFALLALDGREPVAINGSGPAPAALTAHALRDAGLTQIPPDSAHAVTVPGAIDTWCALVSKYGRFDMERILAPAIAAARDGFCVTPRVAYDWNKSRDRISHHAPCRTAFLPDGKAPLEGERFRQPALAETLQRIAMEGRDAFYAGDIAEEMVGVLRQAGGLHTLEDFESFSSFETEPITAPYKGYELMECPPNGQGLAALLIARILDGFAFSEMSEADRIHVLAEACKIGYAMRDAVICDPRSHPVDVEAILCDNTIARLRKQIDMGRATPAKPWEGPTHKDTVYLSVVDADGNAISLINSIFDSFGSGIYAPESGVLFQNRGSGFSLQEGHPNEVEGGKLPFHTIIPAMLMKHGKPVLSFGVMGGQYQAAGQAHFLSQLIDIGLDPQMANEAPRSFCFDGTLKLETTISEDVRADLDSRGHKTAWADEPIGGCQAIWIDRERGLLLGASDHRKDGIALGV